MISVGVRVSAFYFLLHLQPASPQASVLPITAVMGLSNLCDDAVTNSVDLTGLLGGT